VLSLERNLIREVPDDIRHLDELTTLSLAGNDAVAAVPPSVGDLVQLRRLTLRSTRVTVRSLPSEIMHLRRRTTIELGDDDDVAGTAAATEHVAD